MTEKTVPIVRSQPRRPEPKPLLPPPAGWRYWVQAPVMVLSMSLFIVGAATALVGVGICSVAGFCLEWLYGGESAG